MLACAQYDQLIEACGNRCQICSAPASSQQWQKLCVDHDHDLGLWAVRGMLCHGCNRFLDHLPKTHPAVAPYFEGAWHLQQGWSLDMPTEPGLDVQVMEPWGKAWIRTADGWHHTNARSRSAPYRMVIAWGEVIHRFGGHNLHVLLPNSPNTQWQRLYDVAAPFANA